MNQHKNFESLRRLLALKGQETPPPGYFNHFSANVIARIRAGEFENEATETLFSRILRTFELKPAFAGAFASVLCLLVLFGIVYAGSESSTPQGLFTKMDYSPQLAQASASSLAQSPEQAIVSNDTNFNASLQPVAPLFGQQNAFAQQVSFNPGN